MDKPIRLDDWYHYVNSIYLDRNFYRSVESIFGHLVEVIGGLSLAASGKDKPGAVPEEFLGKALGWWMAVCGKVGVRSVEAMVWAKYPAVCSYCHLARHYQPDCDRKRKPDRRPDWARLKEIGEEGTAKRPADFPGWQLMFNVIYPRHEQTSQEMNFSRLGEELGELAEAVRVLPITGSYFMSEASDVFAWLMGVANQFDFGKKRSEQIGAFLENSLCTEYLGGCRYCRGKICKCPPILRSTLGRIGHDVPKWAFAEEPGGNFFTVEEALNYFRMGDELIVLAGKEIEVGPDVVKEVRDLVRFIKDKQIEVHTQLARATDQLDSLTSRQKLTQEGVDNLIEAIQSLPTGSKEVVLGFTKDFLTGVAASAWATQLLKVFSQ